MIIQILEDLILALLEIRTQLSTDYLSDLIVVRRRSGSRDYVMLAIHLIDYDGRRDEQVRRGDDDTTKALVIKRSIFYAFR